MIRDTFSTHKKLVNQILTDSFYDNGSVNYAIVQDSKKRGRISYLVDYSYNIADKFGEIFVSDDKKAVSLIVYSDKKKNNVINDLKLIFKSVGIGNIFNLLKREKMVYSEHPNTPYIHLWYIGVDIQNQGRGYGSLLLEEIISFARQKKLDIYLETSNTKNLNFYNRHGFKNYATKDIDGLKMYFFKFSV